ncbi:probable cytochrome P450 6a13 [Tigriopus californicus]|uniref:probable cytochrome P450 6a13 n=1 Tax=Tigriopus californicus TaxID=6832 RepID=UPI0027DA3E94|nr:probable cytochrome P450 6a13 [Tigriopus californicus]
MTVLVNNVGDDFVQYLSKFSESGDPFNAKDTFTNFTLDTIASCGFGFEARSLTNTESQFRSMVTKSTDVNHVRQFGQYVIMALFPSLSKLMNVELDLFNREAGNFVLDVLGQCIKERRNSKVRRNVS